MGFVSEESTSGFVFPSAYLQSIVIDYKKSSKQRGNLPGGM